MTELQTEGMDATLEIKENPQTSDMSNSDEQEIMGLHSAIEKVMAKIHWHENQIEDQREKIKHHENQIEELRLSLRKHIGPLMSQSLTTRSIPSAKELDSTGALILDCLRQTNKPLNTKQIKNWLVKNDNHTNPSVELSRMVNRGQLMRAGRGLYKLAPAK